MPVLTSSMSPSELEAELSASTDPESVSFGQTYVVNLDGMLALQLNVLGSYTDSIDSFLGTMIVEPGFTAAGLTDTSLNNLLKSTVVATPAYIDVTGLSSTSSTVSVILANSSKVEGITGQLLLNSSSTGTSGARVSLNNLLSLVTDATNFSIATTTSSLAIQVRSEFAASNLNLLLSKLDPATTVSVFTTAMNADQLNAVAANISKVDSFPVLSSNSLVITNGVTASNIATFARQGQYDDDGDVQPERHGCWPANKSHGSQYWPD